MKQQWDYPRLTNVKHFELVPRSGCRDVTDNLGLRAAITRRSRSSSSAPINEKKPLEGLLADLYTRPPTLTYCPEGPHS